MLSVLFDNEKEKYVVYNVSIVTERKVQIIKIIKPFFRVSHFRKACPAVFT